MEGRLVTAYNIPFDFEKFLLNEPWNLGDCCTFFDDIMGLASERVYELVDEDKVEDKGLQQYLLEKRENSRYPTCWVRGEDAYRILCPDDPMDLGNQSHRALDDAMMEAHILKNLIG